MKAILLYHPKDDSFEIYDHDMDDALAEALVDEFKAQDLTAFAIDQAEQHGVISGSCERCKRSGIEFLKRQKTVSSSPPVELTVVPIGGAIGMVSAALPRQRLMAPLSQPALTKLVILAGILLLFAGAIFAFFGPLAPQVESFLLAIASTKIPTEPAPISIVIESPELPSATPAPTYTTTPRPAATLTAIIIPASPTPEGSACLPVESVTLEQVGETVCITGTVIRSYEKDNIFFIIFAEKPDAFYMLSYDQVWSPAKPGVCVIATGEIKQLVGKPVMVFGYQNELEVCP
jgi:hypothetical protein